MMEKVISDFGKFLDSERQLRITGSVPMLPLDVVFEKISEISDFEKAEPTRVISGVLGVSPNK